MNLFDVPDEEYANKSRIRIRDASMLAQKIRAELPRVEQVAVILDIGCGTGYSTLELAARFPSARVIGVDSNPSYIERAPPMTKNVEFYCVDISESGNFSNFCMVTELAESSVNIAVSTYWLTYLASPTRTQAIANLKRLLRPDGYLYLLDLVWTDANAIIYKLNQEENWKSLIMTEMADTTFKLPLPDSETPPSNEQVSKTWVEQFNQQEDLELLQIVRNKLFYRFQSMDEMLHVLESVCGTLHLLNEANTHKYFVNYVRAIFDQYFLVSSSLKLGYANVLVVAHKKDDSQQLVTGETTD